MTRVVISAVSVSWILLLSTPLLAQPPGECEVHVNAVMATRQGPVDEQLQKFKEHFEQMFPYKSYRLLKTERRNVKWGARAGFDLPGGRFLLVIPREYRDGRVAMKVLLVDGNRQVVDTALAVRNQGTFLVGGPKHQEGVLLISIAARSRM